MLVIEGAEVDKAKLTITKGLFGTKEETCAEYMERNELTRSEAEYRTPNSLSNKYVVAVDGNPAYGTDQVVTLTLSNDKCVLNGNEVKLSGAELETVKNQMQEISDDEVSLFKSMADVLKVTINKPDAIVDYYDPDIYKKSTVIVKNGEAPYVRLCAIFNVVNTVPHKMCINMADKSVTYIKYTEFKSAYNTNEIRKLSRVVLGNGHFKIKLDDRHYSRISADYIGDDNEIVEACKFETEEYKIVNCTGMPRIRDLTSQPAFKFACPKDRGVHISKRDANEYDCSTGVFGKDFTNGACTPSASSAFFVEKAISMLKEYLNETNFLNLFKRKINVCVHYEEELGESYVNAFYSQMPNAGIFFGDGTTWAYPFTTAAIFGHELCHMANQERTQLEYAYLTGGLEESLGDICGIALSHYIYADADNAIGDNLLKPEYGLQHVRAFCSGWNGYPYQIQNVADYNNTANDTKEQPHANIGIFNLIACNLAKKGYSIKNIFVLFYNGHLFWKEKMTFTEIASGFCKVLEIEGITETGFDITVSDLREAIEERGIVIDSADCKPPE